jgi:RimJ/RimL family protein N-acetyltransferase
MSVPAHSRRRPLIYRPLARVDAARVCALYDEEYRPAGGGDPRDHYPFPQLLETNWVAAAAGDPSLCWVVAELAGRLIGSAAAVRNIGEPDDRVAEVFGIVVSRGARGMGVGAGLLSHLDVALGDNTAVVLCEARTGDERGWKVARRCGFQPIGFEPFAHTTPVGSESMLPTARVRPSAWSLRASGRRSNPDVRVLESLVSGTAPRSNGDPSGADDDQADVLAIAIRRDDSQGAQLINARLDRRWLGAGVVNLRRLEGEGSGPVGLRYDNRYQVARIEDRDAGFVRVAWDRTDRRARVLELFAESPLIAASLIEAAVAELLAEATDGTLTVAVDLRTDAVALQSRLEKMGFLPTAYYPALIADGPDRIDAVQFTRLDQRPIGQSLGFIVGLDWPEARRLVDSVAAFSHTRASRLNR